MKTFYLRSLIVMELKEAKLNTKEIELIDGLIINREDEANTWVVEAYIDKAYATYFQALPEDDEVIIQVKITSEHNEPATILAKIIGMNALGKEINVLFLGKILDERKARIDQRVNQLLQDGFNGQALIDQLKQ